MASSLVSQRQLSLAIDSCPRGAGGAGGADGAAQRFWRAPHVSMFAAGSLWD
jgi:hypothetical protein